MPVGTELIVMGPYKLPFGHHGKGTSKRISKEHAAEFWAQEELKDLAGKQGCYVFALQAGRGFMPWYVGKTAANFKQEVMQAHQLEHYNDVIYKDRKGTPVLFFVTRPGTLKKIPVKQIDELETFLIQTGRAKNPDLKNSHKTKLPDWGIKGVTRGGRGNPSSEATKFKKMMSI